MNMMNKDKLQIIHIDQSNIGIITILSKYKNKNAKDNWRLGFDGIK